MKRFASLTLLLAVLLGSAACATLPPAASLQSWMEKPVQGAILAWGPPPRPLPAGARRRQEGREGEARPRGEPRRGTSHAHDHRGRGRAGEGGERRAARRGH